MSGLLALLDDVVGIAKVAAASVDDIVSQATKAGVKAAGVVIDDAAVTPKYVDGFAASRELPIIWRIAKGSLKNKLLYLLPVGLLLSTFAPWLIAPLLMLGGAYLCFEGAEKIYHLLVPHDVQHVFAEDAAGDPAHLEEQKAAGAIKTDFILSAEIMTIALAAIPVSNIWMQAVTLAIVGTAITIAVYGTVALIVKADDVGLFMIRNGRWGVIKWLGRALVLAMPGFMSLLTTVGTAAMLWVGGAIVVHCMELMGFAWLEHHIHDWAAMIGHKVTEDLTGAVEWVSKATMNGVFGLALGLLLIPFAGYVIAPAWQKLAGKTATGSH
jgi:uncharacterized protein